MTAAGNERMPVMAIYQLVAGMHEELQMLGEWFDGPDGDVIGVDERAGLDSALAWTDELCALLLREAARRLRVDEIFLSGIPFAAPFHVEPEGWLLMSLRDADWDEIEQAAREAQERWGELPTVVRSDSGFTLMFRREIHVIDERRECHER